jgi:hypothetical protein
MDGGEGDRGPDTVVMEGKGGYTVSLQIPPFLPKVMTASACFMRGSPGVTSGQYRFYHQDRVFSGQKINSGVRVFSHSIFNKQMRRTSKPP